MFISSYRYAYPELDGAFTYIFATNGESFDFSEIQIQGNAHLAFKAQSGDNTDATSILASYVNGDKTGEGWYSKGSWDGKRE